MASKKKQPISAHDLDRIIVRLPEGMRAKIAQLADDNGRSMTAEVVAALEKHLKGVDRISEISEFIEEFAEEIQGIDDLKARLDRLENLTKSLSDSMFSLSRSVRE